MIPQSGVQQEATNSTDVEVGYRPTALDALGIRRWEWSVSTWSGHSAQSRALDGISIADVRGFATPANMSIARTAAG